MDQAFKYLNLSFLSHWKIDFLKVVRNSIVFRSFSFDANLIGASCYRWNKVQLWRYLFRKCLNLHKDTLDLYCCVCDNCHPSLVKWESSNMVGKNKTKMVLLPSFAIEWEDFLRNETFGEVDAKAKMILWRIKPKSLLAFSLQPVIPRISWYGCFLNVRWWNKRTFDRAASYLLCSTAANPLEKQHM